MVEQGEALDGEEASGNDWDGGRIRIVELAKAVRNE
jgi:hypothetical protein